ncbi:hypothetical protein OH77DRAFT_489360 [Trametes cingulata]|nr:hypothetical protein OH77DRAFT_489360 [Trametes cingulata]
MRLPRELYAILLAFCAVGQLDVVSANTEIVNFDASPSAGALFPQTSNWPVLNPSNPQILLQVLPAPVDTSITSVCEPSNPGICHHETWLSLDLDQEPWLSYSKFTCRISWPASHPAEFFIDLYTPSSLASVLSGSDRVYSTHPAGDNTLTRRKYARIRLISQAVFTPSPATRNRTVEPVPFMVIVEPLYLGVIPASLVPTLATLLALVAVTAFFVLPRIHAYLSAVADQVRSETASAEERRKQ